MNIKVCGLGLLRAIIHCSLISLGPIGAPSSLLDWGGVPSLGMNAIEFPAEGVGALLVQQATPHKCIHDINGTRVVHINYRCIFAVYKHNCMHQ